MATVYPSQIDTTISLPSAVDNSTPVKSEIVNRLRDAILAIEGELGVDPAGIYGTVAYRLTSIENAITGGGGGSSVIFGGDLFGTNTSQTVVGIRGILVSSTAPTTNQILQYLGGQWTPAAPPITFGAGGDLSGNNISQTVIGIHGVPVSSTTPTPGQLLEFNGTQYIPTTLAGDITGTISSNIVSKLHGVILSATAPVQSAVLVYDTSGAQYDIRQLTLDDIAPSFTINSFTGGSTVEIGSIVSPVSFTMSYNQVPLSAQITNTDGINSPLTVFAPFTSATNSGSFSHNTQTSTVFTLMATGTATKTATTNINFYPRMFGGVGAAGATSSVTASGNTAILSNGAILASEGLTSNPVNAIYGPFSPSAQKIYLLLTGGSHTFKDPNTGFGFAFNSPTSVSFTNQNSAVVAMFLYESTNLLSATFSVQVVT